ncbi:transposase [Kutzneria kofuensis]|uniref:transposase n=1 Tax=Kutzneria kofuensis TaxID=103725 RepID=UPI001C8615E9
MSPLREPDPNTRSGRNIVHSRYPWVDHIWSPSYFAGSCGGTPLSSVREHIENQKHPK